MRKVLVQAGHLFPLQPRHESETGAVGEVALVHAIRDALVALLRKDGRFEPLPMPGLIPWGTACDAALFLHADADGPTAHGCSFGFDERYPVNKRLADLVWVEFEKIGGHPSRRIDNGTGDAHYYYGFGLVDTPGPEVLVEHGFITNPAERAWMEGHVGELARAEYLALCTYFGLPPDPGKPQLPGGADAETKRATNLRAEPKGAAAVLAKAAKGTAVRVLDVAADPAWRRVRLTGFVPVSALQRPGDADTVVTPATTLIAAPRATRAGFERYVLARPHGSASDDEVREILGHYVENCVPTGLDPLIAVSQMVLETGGLSSWWSAPPRRNLAGIGVTGEDHEGETFETWSSAVRAHVGRLLRYALPEGKETTAQQALIDEALAVRDLDKGYWGIAPTLAGLAGSWAKDAAYATKIARIANDVIAGRRSDLIPAETQRLLPGVAEDAQDLADVQARRVDTR